MPLGSMSVQSPGIGTSRLNHRWFSANAASCRSAIPSNVAGYSRTAPHNRADPLVALLHCPAMVRQRPLVLHPAVRYRPMITASTAHLGCISECALDRHTVPVPEFSGRSQLDPLDRPAAAHLFYYRVYRCAGFDSGRQRDRNLFPLHFASETNCPPASEFIETTSYVANQEVG